MTKKIQLKNGLRVLLVETHKSPVVTVQMWVKTGSADEGLGEEGISHFIEHLLFKGTQKYKVGEIATLVEGSGGELNAYTSFDQTVYHVTLSKHFVETGIEIISEMIGKPLFEEEEIENEREVVLEEVKQTQDNPQRQSTQTLFSTVYKNHPYRYPVIGQEKTIQKVSRKTLLNYFEERYVPENMLLLVVGDFDTKDTQAQIKRHFEKLLPSRLRRVKRKKEKVQSRARIAVSEQPFEAGYLHLAWPIPSALHSHVPALDLLAAVFGQGDSSRLVRRLRIDQPLVNSCVSSTFTPMDQGFFAISATFNPDNLKSILTVLREEILKILEEPPSTEEIKRSIVSFESDEFYGLETVDGIASKLGHFEFLTGDPSYFTQYMKEIYNLRACDLSRMAKKYLKADKISISATVPRGKEEITTLLREFVTALRKGIKKIEKKRIPSTSKIRTKRLRLSLGKASQGGVKTPEVSKIVLSSGTTVILRPNRETPVMSLRLAVLGGLRIEPSEMQGLTELTSRGWTGGTQTCTEVDLYRRLDDWAATLSAFGGRNTIGLALDLLKPFQEEVLDLFLDVLLHPAFGEEVLSREKKIILEAIKAFEDNPAQMTIQNFLKTLFGGHPYARRLLGSPQSVEALDHREVFSTWKKQVCSKNMVISIAGDFDENKVMLALDSATSGLAGGERINTHYPFEEPVEEERVFSKLDREQTHIFLGYKGLTFNDPDRDVAKLLNTLLAGQGGRLFMQLRDRASLAYSVSPFHMEGIDAGYFGVYISCSPQKGQLAISMIKEELAKLMSDPVLQDELDRAKRYVVGRHDIDLQTNRSVAGAIVFDEIYGVPFDETFRFAERINQVTSGQVCKMAQRVFNQPAVVSAVGPSAPW